MVFKILSDLISGVRDGVAWGRCFLPPTSPLARTLDYVCREPASSASSTWSNVATRAAKKCIELAARNRYARYLDLTIEETNRWATDAALRAEFDAAAQAIADAFRTPITIIACDGLELAIVEPSTQALALHTN